MVLQPRESLQTNGDSTEQAITIENLKHTYDGKYFALNDLSLSIKKGEVFGLAGAFVMLIGAYVIIGSLQLSLWGALTAFGVIAIGSIFFGSLMLLIAGLVKSNNAYNSIQILILFVVNFASTVFYSFSTNLPLPIQILFLANPLTYVANAARGGFVGTLPTSDLWQVPLLVVETVVVLALATRVYVKSDVSFV